MVTKLAVDHFDLGQINSGAKASFILEFAAGETKTSIIPVNVVKGIHPDPVLLVLAAVHGDEYEGVQTVIELFNNVKPDQIRGTLVMVPVANVPSYYGVSRTTPEDGCNLAREFPGNPEGSVTQRLAWHLARRLIDKADFMIDLHSGGTHYAVTELVGYYYNDDSEYGRECRKAAEVFGTDVIWGHPEVPPGRTTSRALENKIPWLYTEAFGGRRINPAEQRKFLQGVYNIMDHLGMFINPAQWVQHNKSHPIKTSLVGLGNFDESVLSEVEGFFIPQVKLLDLIKEGDPIGVIYSWFGETLKTAHASSEGIIVGLCGTPYIKENGILYTFTQTEQQWKNK